MRTNHNFYISRPPLIFGPMVSICYFLHSFFVSNWFALYVDSARESNIRMSTFELRWATQPRPELLWCQEYLKSDPEGASKIDFRWPKRNTKSASKRNSQCSKTTPMASHVLVMFTLCLSAVFNDVVWMFRDVFGMFGWYVKSVWKVLF